jgi:hypothetical protein
MVQCVAESLSSGKRPLLALVSPIAQYANRDYRPLVSRALTETLGSAPLPEKPLPRRASVSDLAMTVLNLFHGQVHKPIG